MKRVLLIFTVILFTLQANICKATNIIGGVLSSNTTLNLSSSPYYLTSDLTVDSTTTLTIENGVQIFVGGNYEIVIDGELYIEGTKNNPVKIEGDKLTQNVNVFWKGIRVGHDSAKLNFNYLQIKNAANAIDYSGIVVKNQPQLPIAIDGCVFVDNITAIRTTVGSNKGFIRNSTFKNNKLGIDGSGVYSDSANYGYFVSGAVSVKNCLFENNDIASVYISYVSNSTFYNNNSAINFSIFGSIDTCVFKHNKVGVRAVSESFRGNDFIANDTGLILYGKDDSITKLITLNELTVSSTLFANNSIGVLVDNNARDFSFTCNQFTKNGVAFKTPGQVNRLFIKSKENVINCFFDENDTAVLIDGSPTVNSVWLDKYYFGIEQSYFNGGNYYVYNKTKSDINLFRTIFVDTVRAVETYLYDKSDDTSKGAFNYYITTVQYTHDPNVVGEYFYFYLRESLVLKHNRYTKDDTTFHTVNTLVRCRYTQQQPTLGIQPIIEVVKTTRIYPNPVASGLNIISEKYTIKQITLYGINGNKVNEVDYNVLSDNHIVVDVSWLAKGVYFVEILTNDNSIFREKFIKQ